MLFLGRHRVYALVEGMNARGEESVGNASLDMLLLFLYYAYPRSSDLRFV